MISYNFHPKKKLIVTIFYGNITSEELYSHISKLLEIDIPEGEVRGLNIFCKDCKTKEIKAHDILSAGERMRHANFRKNGKNAIVTNSLLSYGLSRMYKFASDIMNLDELNIYKDNNIIKAIEWLDVDDLKEEIYSDVALCEQRNSSVQN